MAAPRRTRTRIQKCTCASQVDIIINYQDTYKWKILLSKTTYWSCKENAFRGNVGE